MFSGQLAGHLCLESPLLLSSSTQVNPLCPRPPVTACSLFLLRKPRLPGIPAYANSNGILTRLVTSFLLLFTTSSDVLCSKFSGVSEMLWIFKVVRWTHDRCTKINKTPPVSNGIGASSFRIWIVNLAQLLTLGTLTNSQTFIFGDSNWKRCSWLPSRNPKTWYLDADICDFFFKAFILVEKIKTCWIYKNNVFASWEKYSELKLFLCIYYWFLKLYTRIIWHSYFPLHGIS